MRVRGVLLLLLLLAGARTAVAKAKKGPCKPKLSMCQPRGCEKEDTAPALSNILKHNLQPQGSLQTLTFADFRSLQAQVETLFNGK
jgi:hypothetical protein